MTTISREYQEHLCKEHSNSNWGSTGAKYSGDRVLSLLRSRPQIQTVLDFGAGKQSLGEYIIRQDLGRSNIEWTNYDPGVPGIDQIPNKTFDLVVTSDVLEHVEIEALPSVLATLQRLTKQVLFNDIACYPTGAIFGEGPYKGQDMHLNVSDPSWWRRYFTEHLSLQEFEYNWIERRNKGRVKTRCVLIHERV